MSTKSITARLNPLFIVFSLIIAGYIFYSGYNSFQRTKMPSLLTGDDMYTICTDSNCKSFPYEINPQAGDSNLIDIPEEYGQYVNIFSERSELDEFNMNQKKFMYSYIGFGVVFTLICVEIWRKNKISFGNSLLNVNTFLLGYNPPLNIHNFISSGPHPLRFQTTSSAELEARRIEKVIIKKSGTVTSNGDETKPRIGLFDELYLQYRNHKREIHLIRVEPWLFPGISKIVNEILESGKKVDVKIQSKKQEKEQEKQKAFVFKPPKITISFNK